MANQLRNKLFSDFANFKIIRHATRKGLSQTRLDGAKSAGGEFITFIDKRTRPDEDYLAMFLSKKRNIVIGNPYIDMSKGIWSRVLSLVRIKLYYPYFNTSFEDIILGLDDYRNFKNKGGGGSMLVKREYYLRVAKSQTHSPHANDDSKFIEELSKIEPVLKTCDAKTEYLNRTGHIENILHLYNRGPKFIDYYFKRGSRFYYYILIPLLLLPFILIALFIVPRLLFFMFASLAFAATLAASFYFSKGAKDFFSCAIVLPIALVSFSIGISRGLVLKLLKVY
jgi:hypothetical protein